MKNKFMRTAAMLLVLTLVTTCMVGGTFAKYITKDDYTDSARVAQFGVVLEVATGSNFSETYKDPANQKVTVETDTEGQALVAPGTGDAEGIRFKITGTPEVATKLTIAMENAEEVFLKDGTYNDYTQATKADGSYETFTLAEDYYPVKFTLKQTAGVYKEGGEYKTATADAPFTVVNAGTLAQVETAVEAASIEFIKPNHALDSEYVLTWAWDFGDSANNQADTVLGQIAAEKYTVDAANYNLDIKYDITFTVEQID